ncbi:MAG: acyl-CoA thioesterase [Victivallaceae bacterium]|nr:acyl-CoA thioesterase [Victivallaceae bacterium]
MHYDYEYRVPYADTDRMGVVYHANYLVLFERARTEMLRSAGVSCSELERTENLLLPVLDAGCRYIRPARYDDLVTVRVWVSEMSRVRMRIESQVLRDGELLVEGYVRLGCVNLDFRPIRMPEVLRLACEKFMEGARSDD